MLAAIRQWVIKTMMKGQTGVVTSLPKKEIIEMNVQITAERMMRNGINPEDMKTVGQVENVVKQIDTPKVNVNAGVTSVKKADVLDMEGNKIDTSKGIMGGKEIKPIDELQNYTKSKEDIVQDLVDRKFGKGYFDTVDESEAAIKARIEADNEKGIASMKKKLDDPEEKADGGRIGLLAGSVPKVLKLLKNKKKIQAAVDDIFPTGDYKYDAQMAADSLVENNPNTFGGKLYEDLDLDTQMEVYGAVIGPIQSNALTLSKMKKATKPEKTLASMKEGKGIDMSDPDIAEEFARFMKETDPKGSKTIEQTVELSNFDPKGRKKNSDGGRIGLFLGGNLEGGYSKSRTDSGGKQTTVSFGGGEGGNKKPPPPKRTSDGGVTDIKLKKPTRFNNLDNNFTKFDLKDLVNLYQDEEDENMKVAGLNQEQVDYLNKVGGKVFNVDDTGDFFNYDSPTDIKKQIEKLNPESENIFGTFKPNKIVEGDPNTYATEKDVQDYIKSQFPTLRTGGREIGLADGGRIGYKAGSVDKIRRLFLKTIGAGTAGIAGAKSGIFSFGKGAGKEVAKEVAQQTTSSMPPPYFFKLAEKIKMLGDDATATTDRTIAKTLKSKDGKSTYLLEEDVATGDTIIKKINKEGDEMITDVEIMELKKGEVVMGKDGKPIKVPDEYEEVTEANARIEGDTFNDPYYTDGIQVDEIIKEVDDKVPSIKYASGGLAYMLGE